MRDLNGWHAAGRGVIEQEPRRMVRAGYWPVKPTAAVDFVSGLARDDNGLWVSQPYGGGYEWHKVGGTVHRFNVKDYGAAGNGTADDTAEIAAALTAADAVDGTVFLPRGTYKTTAALTLPANVIVEGEGRGTIIKPTGDGFNALNLTGTLGSTAALSANASEGGNAVTLVAGSVAALGLAAGDLLWISDTVPAPGVDDATGHDQMTLIQSIAGEVLTLVDALYEPFLTANSATVRKVTPKTGTGLRRLTLDGSALTDSGASGRGLLWTNTRDCFIEDCHFTNFVDAGVYLERGYGNALRRLRLSRCGSASESDISFSRQSNGLISGILSEWATGFGPQFLFSNNCAISDVTSVGAQGRGVKLHTASYNRLTNIAANHALFTGFGITLESDHNVIHGLTTLHNGNEGIWFHTNGNNDFNQIYGAVSSDNGSYELAFNVGCDNNYVEGWFDTAGFGVRHNGTDNVYVNLLTSAGFDIHGNATISTLAGVGSRTVVADANGLLSAGSATSPGTIVVQEGDSTVSTAGTIDFDASDFNVTESPAGEANVALAYGTSAGTPTEGGTTVLKAGDTMTGNLVVSAANPVIESRGSNSALFRLQDTGGAADQKIIDFIANGGTLVLQLTTDAGGQKAEILTIATTGTTTFNEDGNDQDFRVEGDTDANLVFADASTDRVGIGNNAPNNKLDVTGTVQADGLRVDQTPTAETPTPTHTFTVSLNGTTYRIPCLV